MKKIVRTVWISILSGLAFLVACTSSKGLTRAEKKQLKEERTSLISQIDQERQDSQFAEDPGILMNYRNSELQLRRRLSEINGLLGDEEAVAENERLIGNINSEMDSLQAVIDKSKEHPLLYGVPIIDPTYELRMKEQRRNELTEQLNQLMQAIQRREGACVYGSPEVIQRYGQETRRMYQEAEALRQQIKELDEDDNKAGKE